MKIKVIRCGICEHWHNHVHCPNCGAFGFTINGKRRYFNRAGIEMARAIPLPIHRMVKQDWKEDRA